MSKATVDKHSGAEKTSTTSTSPFMDKANKDRVEALENDKKTLTLKNERQALEIQGLKIEIQKRDLEIHALKDENGVPKEARGEGDESLKATGPGKFKQTIPAILLVSFTMASTNQDLDQNENNATEVNNPIIGRWPAVNDRQFTTDVVCTIADFSLAPQSDDSARASQSTDTTGQGSLGDAGSKINGPAVVDQGMSSGAATGVPTGGKKRKASNLSSSDAAKINGPAVVDQGMSSGAATGVPTGGKKRKASNLSSSDAATGSTSGRTKRQTGAKASKLSSGTTSTTPTDGGTTKYPANKYGFHYLVSKNKIEEGDEMKIPLHEGENPTLPNPNFVIMEYRGRAETPKNATKWILKTSTPVDCTAVGPEQFKKILEENGISGHPMGNFSKEVEIIRAGQSLGNITEIKERTLRGL